VWRDFQLQLLHDNCRKLRFYLQLEVAMRSEALTEHGWGLC